MKESSGAGKESCCLVFPSLTKHEMKRPRNRIARNLHSSNRWLQLLLVSVYLLPSLWHGPKQSRSQRLRSFAHAHEYLVSKQRRRVIREMQELCILYFLGKSGSTQIDLKS